MPGSCAMGRTPPYAESARRRGDTMKAWLIWAFAIGLLAGSAPARAADPFVIEAVFPLSGSGAFLGKAEQQTLGVMETIINRGGGISGQPVHFNVADDASSPQV